MKKFILSILLSICSVIVSAEPALNVYIGSNYIATPTIDRLQKLCNCHLVQSYFNDNEEMLAKMVAGATGYHVIVATSYAVDELAKMGKIQPLDKKRIPNLKYILLQFLNQEYDQGNKYSIPYAILQYFWHIIRINLKVLVLLLIVGQLCLILNI